MFTMKAMLKNIHLEGTGWLCILFLLFLQIEEPQARSFSPSDDIFSTAVKRNTWWSKRTSPLLSTIDSIPRKDLLPESLRCDETLDIYECYIENCVESFVTCARQADSEELFSACKMIHKLCGTSCASNRRGEDP